MKASLNMHNRIMFFYDIDMKVLSLPEGVGIN